MADMDMNNLPQSDKDGIVVINGRRIRVNADGSLTDLDGKDIATQSVADQEHANLDYLINSHPDRLADVDAARARRDELNKEIGNNSDDNVLADKKAKLRAAKLKIQLNAGINIMAQQKQND